MGLSVGCRTVRRCAINLCAPGVRQMAACRMLSWRRDARCHFGDDVASKKTGQVELQTVSRSGGRLQGS